MSTRDLAVTVVEMVIVIAEAAFWQGNRLYSTDLHKLFSVLPVDILRRTANALVPGRHSMAVNSPDMYGPVLMVFLLPQALLTTMDGVSLHGHENGCGRPSLLGNSVVISLYLWMGLSFLYRLLAFIIAPDLDLRHCLCVTGYSYFWWSVALALSHLCDMHDEVGVPASFPLALIGIPSSVAVGYIFWEHTPLSSISVQSTTSVQCRSIFNEQLLQRLLWCIPKIIAFVIVAGTHYQFLWYLARVFLPSKQELCRLSALMRPAQYAEILSQKELRKFAMVLLQKASESKP